MLQPGFAHQEDLDGIELSWGNSEAVIAILKKIANVEGCGAILAKGSEAAANYWGKGHEYLITIKGMELPLHDPKFAPGFVRTYQFDPTPGRHVKGGLGHMQEVGDLKDKYNYYNTGYLDVENTVNVEVLTAAGFCLMMDFPARREHATSISRRLPAGRSTRSSAISPACASSICGTPLTCGKGLNRQTLWCRHG